MPPLVLVAEIKEDMIAIDGKPYNYSTDFIYLLHGKFPCIVIKEWDLIPVGTEDYYKAAEAGRTIDPALIIIRIAERGAEELLKKKISPKMIVFGVIGLGILIYVLSGGI